MLYNALVKDFGTYVCEKQYKYIWLTDLVLRPTSRCPGHLHQRVARQGDQHQQSHVEVRQREGDGFRRSCKRVT